MDRLPNNRQPKVNDNLVDMGNIRVEFGSVVALDGVEFSVGRNEIVGLLGDNGAGKTTLAKTLIGCHRPSAGEIFLEGRPTQFQSPREARLAGIETGYQDQALVDTMSISRNFFLGRELEKRIGPLRVLDREGMAAIATRELAELGLDRTLGTDLPVSYLAGGDRQVIVIGRAICFGAKLLILDEPTAALSEDKIQLVLKLVRKAREKGLSVVFITHKAEEVFQVADRFVVLSNGKNYANFRKEDTNLKELEKLFIYSRLTAMRELAASMAHQIKNPLGVMKVATEMLRDGFHVTEKEDQYASLVGMLVSEIETLTHVTDNFLDYARPLRFQEGLFPVEAVIRDAIKALPLQNFADIEIELSIPDVGVEHAMDKNLMQHAVSNLLMNALEASQPGGRVAVRVRPVGEKLHIEVQDWGCGIEDSTKKQMFNFFFTTKKRGTGLGLAVVRRIVQQHRGEIEVLSSPRMGSTFRIVI